MKVRGWGENEMLLDKLVLYLIDKMLSNCGTRNESKDCCAQAAKWNIQVKSLYMAVNVLRFKNNYENWIWGKDFVIIILLLC